MLWLQKTPWEVLHPRDFITIMPNPRYNKLEKPIVLPSHSFDEMFLHVYWYITMYLEFKEYGLTPWHNGRVLSSDIRCLQMMDQMVKDAEEVERRMAGAKQKTEAEIKAKYGNDSQQNQTRPHKKILYRRK